MIRYGLLALAAAALVACGSTADDAQDAADATTAPRTTPTLSRPAPTATAAPSVQIEFLRVAGAAPGGRASVTIRTDPVGVTCDIRYRTPMGEESEAQGLEPGTTRGSGTYSWEWTVGVNTQPGTGRVIVTCADAEASSEIEIGP